MAEWAKHVGMALAGAVPALGLGATLLRLVLGAPGVHVEPSSQLVLGPVEVSEVLAVGDFPADVEAGTMLGGARKPHPDDPPLAVPSDADIADFQASLIADITEAAAVCGYPGASGPVGSW